MDTTRTAKTTRPAPMTPAEVLRARRAAEVAPISYGHPLRSDDAFVVYVDVVASRAAGHRALRAAVLRLAAEIEERSGGADRWVVNVGHCSSDTHGRVEIELVRGDETEVRRAVQVAAAAILGVVAKASV